MDIRRGDQVYYRGEVFAVKEVFPNDPTGPWIDLTWPDFPTGPVVMTIDPRLAERVEQVR